MTIEVGDRVTLVEPRRRQPDPYNQYGWKGEVLEINIISDEFEEASGNEVWAGERQITVKWDNGYISDVYPENGDMLE